MLFFAYRCLPRDHHRVRVLYTPLTTQCHQSANHMLGAATAPAPFSLSTATLRNLGHKEYEKRKQAALEVRAPMPRTALRQPS